MRLGALVSLLLIATTAHAATIEVFPGPGTPLQDAISSAASGQVISIHAGVYTESVVVDRRVRLRTADEGVVIDAGCTADTALDIAADDVRVSGIANTATALLTIKGGASRTVRVDGRTGVTLKTLNVYGCPGGTGLEISNSSDVKTKLVHVRDGLVGISVRASTYVKLASSSAQVRQTGLRLEDIAPNSPLAGAKVSVRNGLFHIHDPVTPPERGIHFVAADGVAVKRVDVFGGAGTCIELDANSDNNRIVHGLLHTTSGGVFLVDGGNGNQILDPYCNNSNLPPCP